jgi:hypothetical protein
VQRIAFLQFQSGQEISWQNKPDRIADLLDVKDGALKILLAWRFIHG